MGLSIGLIVIQGAVVAQIIWALVWAVRAIRRSRHLAPAQAMAMRFIAVHLAEPIVNVVAIGGLLFFVNENYDRIILGGDFFRPNPVQTNVVLELFASTWPMLILLAPIFGIVSADAMVEHINTRLVILGIARWIITVLILVVPLALPVGMLLLWYCVAWCRRQIKELAAYSHHAIGFGSEGLLVDYTENMEPGAARIND